MDPAPQLEPDEYDVIVVGSGLPESMLAGALAKAGKSVLLIDPADLYGGAWSTLSMDQVPAVARPAVEQPASEQLRSSQLTDGCRRVPVDIEGCISISNLEQYTDGTNKGASPQILIDLTPKVLYQGEELVELLVACKAHNYVEFKLVENCYILGGGALRPVPASKSEVFRDRSLSIADKRALMGFINACMQAANGEGPLKDSFDERPVQQLLQHQGLSCTLQDIVMYGIAMCTHQQEASSSSSGGSTYGNAGAPASGSSMSAAQARQALLLFVQSLGRYGSGGAFMSPSYGTGALAEAFVRYAAVNGAVTALRCGLQDFLVDSSSGRCAGVTTTSGQHLKCKEALLASAPLLTHLASAPASSTKLSRAIAILDRPLRDGESSVALVVPPGALGSHQAQPVQGLQLGPATCITPPGRFVLHLSMISQMETAEQDLAAAVAALVNTSSLHKPALVPAGSTACAGNAESGTAASELAVGPAPTSAEAAAAAAAAAVVVEDEKMQEEKQGSAAAGAQERLAAGAGAAAAAAAAAAEEISSHVDLRPVALDVFYLNVHHSSAMNPEALPPNVACCCSPDASLFGYQWALEQCKQLHAHHFGGCQWLGDLCAEAADQVADEAERDAIDDLQSVLQILQPAANS